MEATTAPRMVPGYRHVPGNHCGSTALRNLLAFHGAEISEEMALGLGAGLSFYYVPLDGASPSRFTNGRVGRLEEQFLQLTGAPLRLDTFDDPEASWDAAREVVDDARPAILITDLYYLDHYGTSAHFPGHAVVLAGYDAEAAYLSDTSFEELQRTRLENLARARHGDHPVFPLDGHMFSVPPGAELGDVRGAAPGAIERNARQMIEPPLGEFEGLPALRRFAAEVGDWPQGLEDWQWCALLLPGDRAARDRGRELPADVLALPPGGGQRAGSAGRRGRRWMDRPRRVPARRQRGRCARGRALVAGRQPRRRRSGGRGAPLARTRRLAQVPKRAK
jgi:hypothetical protein